MARGRYIKQAPYGDTVSWAEREYEAIERALREIDENVTDTQRLKVRSETGTSYTLALTDENYVIQHTNASAITVTVPTNASVAFEVGSAVHPAQWGAGQVTVAGADGTVNIRTASTLKTRTQYSMCSLVKVGTNEWVFFGDML